MEDNYRKELECLCGELATILHVTYNPRKGETRVSFWLRKIGEALAEEQGCIRTVKEQDFSHAVNAMTEVVEHPTIEIMKGMDTSLDLAITKLRLWRNNMNDHQPSTLAAYKTKLEAKRQI